MYADNKQAANVIRKALKAYDFKIRDCSENSGKRISVETADGKPFNKQDSHVVWECLVAHGLTDVFGADQFFNALNTLATAYYDKK